VLNEAKAADIVRRLGWNGPPHRDQRCLACHATPTGMLGGTAAEAIRQEGVGCEACHGPAAGWIAEHATSAWRGLDATEKSKRGMTFTTDLFVRARLCTGCHVGGPDGAVGHELIASGHPRLTFELAGYLADLPRHWDEKAQKRARPDLEAATWTIGQLVSLRASLALLHARAQAATLDARDWPEFAEYDCASCHSDVAANGPLPRRPSDLPPGALSWNSWHVPVTRRLARHAGGMGLDGPKGLLGALRAEMSRPGPHPAAVVKLAGRIVEELDRRLHDVPIEAMLQDRPVAELLDGLAADAGTIEGPGRDHATQLYLALTALLQAQADQGKPTAPGARAAQQKLAQELGIPER
jgi:hypothetical protein